MILVNKHNFAVTTMQKSQKDVSLPGTSWYSDLKVCLALEGDAVWCIENRSYAIQPGDIVFLNIGQKRSFTSFGKNGFKLCSFVLRRNAFANPQHFLFFLERVKNQENLLRSRELAGLLEEAYDEWNREDAMKYELISAKLTEFFIKARRMANFVPKADRQGEAFFLQAIRYIDGNITNGIDLQSAAKHTGLNESTFSRRFLQWNGISFQQYVMEKKIQHAVMLLQTSNRKVIDIAFESGFDSVSGFYHAFRKVTGTTPGKFSGFSV